MILLRIRLRPPSHECRHRIDAGHKIILHCPKRQITSNIRINARKHRRPLAPTDFNPTNQHVCKPATHSKFQNLRISINPPFPSRRLDSRDPLLRQRLIPRRAELERITFYTRLASIFGFDVQPEVVDGDFVVVDRGEELADLGRDGFAGYTCGLGSGAYLRGVG